MQLAKKQLLNLLKKTLSSNYKIKIIQGENSLSLFYGRQEKEVAA
jgi:hypothetical protein